MNTYLNEILDLYGRQAQTEIAELCRGNIAPSPQQLADIHRRHIERCEPVYTEMARERGLRSAPDPISIPWDDPQCDPLADIRAARAVWEQRSDLEFRGLAK